MERIRVTGLVQGVGFRPTVWRLARECRLTGRVWNDAAGVMIEVFGHPGAIDRFLQRLQAEPPPLARIDQIQRSERPPHPPPPQAFTISASRDGQPRTGIAADAATCPACLAEVLDPSDRRYRYPFTNCTHCGPRLSITRAIPYDRKNTSMAAFPMCSACEAEYQDPANRRFHAQPNACPDCGPRLWLEDTQGHELPAEPDRDDLITTDLDKLFTTGPDRLITTCLDQLITTGPDPIQQAAALIRAGRIIAIKGIGGIHLACDAGNECAVTALRRRKRREHKAFALMARDLDMLRRYAEVDAVTAALLSDRAAPIVILERSGDRLADTLAANLAPGIAGLGFMLPYTPIHHLLMQDLDRPIVLTSGNRSDEPQATSNDAARERLAGIADYYLLHDRDIVNRLDDSVIRNADQRPRLLRRARGYAPKPIRLADGFKHGQPILAMGAELKNTFCLLQDGQAILSQHIGDLEDALGYRDYRHTLDLYQDLFAFKPAIIAVDRHPNYQSTQLGHDLATDRGLEVIEVQHHHAHIAACLAEHGRPLDAGPVLGIALDGLGMGDNGQIWGGEFLLTDYRGYRRLAYFQPVAMPGGTQAIREPWRNTLAHLSTHPGWSHVVADWPDLDIVRYLSAKPLKTLQTMLTKGLNSPPASSAGRLFDAVAAAVGVCRESASFEGQAAIELEALATPYFGIEADNGYGYRRQGEQLSWAPLWSALLQDLHDRIKPGRIAARFHHGLANAVTQTAVDLAQHHHLDTIVLSGGVFQNRLLLERCSTLLRQRELRVLSPQRVPANDGGIALGQAVIALAGLSTR